MTGQARKRAENDDRVRRVTVHILANLDEMLDTGELAAQCGLSRFHFLRRFKHVTGITVGQYIRQARLKRAALQLLFNRQRRITDIALDAGFEFPESFTRAFRRLYGQAPSQFRRRPDWDRWWPVHHRQRHPLTETSPMNVHIVNFPETRIAALEHHGPESQTYRTVQKFIAWRQANRIRPDQGDTYGIHYSDPTNTFPEDYRLDVCVSVARDIADNPQGVVNKTIPACRCAVARHKGSRAHVSAAEFLVYDWLPGSGEALGDFPIFFHYLNVGPDVAEHAMITDVYLPLKDHDPGSV